MEHRNTDVQNVEFLLVWWCKSLWNVMMSGPASTKFMKKMH